jgi:hypothetical protein
LFDRFFLSLLLTIEFQAITADQLDLDSLKDSENQVLIYSELQGHLKDYLKGMYLPDLPHHFRI